MYITPYHMQRIFRLTILFLAVSVLPYSYASKDLSIDDTHYIPPAQPKRQTLDQQPAPANKPETQFERTPGKSSDDPLNTPPPSGLNRIVNIFKPYKIDIQQGNFISHEMLARVRHDMTKEQVRFVLGTPLLIDIFHAERWDYLFRMRKANDLITTSKVTVFFKDNRVQEIRHDELPSEADYLSRIVGRPSPKSTFQLGSDTINNDAAKSGTEHYEQEEIR